MNEVIQAIQKYKILVIFRGFYGNELLRIMEALYEGGIRLAEVTFDQADQQAVEKTSEAIRNLRQAFPALHVGSGTALCVEQVEATKEAGGEFVLSPNTNFSVIQATKACGLVSIPGAMTPSEILSAYEAGADIVKIFPAAWLGLRYLKDVLGPIHHIPFMATAGITEENLKEFLEAGYCSAGISGRLLDREVLARGDYPELTRRARTLMRIAGEASSECPR